MRVSCSVESFMRQGRPPPEALSAPSEGQRAKRAWGPSQSELNIARSSKRAFSQSRCTVRSVRSSVSAISRSL